MNETKTELDLTELTGSSQLLIRRLNSVLRRPLEQGPDLQNILR